MILHFREGIEAGYSGSRTNHSRPPTRSVSAGPQASSQLKKHPGSSPQDMATNHAECGSAGPEEQA